MATNHINTLIYMVRRLRTVDAAAQRVADDELALPMDKDGTHLPFVCTKYLNACKSNLGVPREQGRFRVVTKGMAVLKLAARCGCSANAMEMEEKGIPLYQGVGKFYRDNVEAMMERILEEAPDVELGPFPFTVVKRGGHAVEHEQDGEEYEATRAELEREMQEARAKMVEAQQEFSRCYEVYTTFLKKK